MSLDDALLDAVRNAKSLADFVSKVMDHMKLCEHSFSLRDYMAFLGALGVTRTLAGVMASRNEDKPTYEFIFVDGSSIIMSMVAVADDGLPSATHDAPSTVQ